MLNFKRLSSILVLTVISFTHLYAQKPGLVKRYVNSIFNDTTAAEKATLTIYPTFASSPETGVELGFSAMKLFYAKNDTANRLSELQALVFGTLKGQYGGRFDNAIYGNKDKWFFLGESKIQQFPMSYFGIGPQTQKGNSTIVDAFSIALTQRILRKVKGNIFAGPEIDFQSISGVEFRNPELHPAPYGSTGATNLGLGWSFVYDTRHNVLNVREGIFAELAYLHYPKGFVNNESFSTINMELRSFHKIKKNQVFAWQLKGQFMDGTIPFSQLALLGGDKLMRGYYVGRYRDKNMIAAQAEYRFLPFPFSKRIGGVLFASAGMVSPKVSEFSPKNLRYAGGVGLRYLLFPKKDIYIRFDLGFTEEGTNLYILNGESF